MASWPGSNIHILQAGLRLTSRHLTNLVIYIIDYYIRVYTSSCLSRRSSSHGKECTKQYTYCSGDPISGKKAKHNRALAKQRPKTALGHQYRSEAYVQIPSPVATGDALSSESCNFHNSTSTGDHDADDDDDRSEKKYIKWVSRNVNMQIRALESIFLPSSSAQLPHF